MISIKEKLIERIKASKNEALLKELYDLLGAEEQLPLYFNEEQSIKIMESDAEYRKGNVIPHEEAKKQIRKRLGK